MFIKQMVMNFLPLPLLLTAALRTGSADAQAQAYPQRPVRIIVNVSAGGGVDIVARIAGSHMSAVWGQTFVVDNRTGAGGAIGAELAAKAAPDGHTLLVSSSTLITTAAARMPGASGYDPVRDLQAVSKLTANPYIICVTPSLPVTSIKELIALAKTKSGGVSYGSSGNGAIIHMGAALLASMAGVNMVHVPYKGVVDVYPAVAAGQVDWVMGSPISALPLIKAGRMKGIAVSSARRARTLPELPTVAESGLPGYEVTAWYGMFAPSRTPMSIVNSLQAEAKRALQSPDVVRRMDAEGTDIVASAPVLFAEEVKAEFEKWRAVVKKAGLQ